MRDFMRDSIAPHRRIPVAIAVALTAVVAGCGGDAPSPTGEATTADLVLTNARVYTFDWAPPGPDGTPADGAPYDADTGWQADASAVAMRGNRIVYVGDDAGAAAFVGPETQTVDLDRA
ncbi:MAG: hypothetical protein KJP18_08485, partial [Gemmatimonadetes bacterium]|nr:hypothetical protein [Gemmatimonadota bacterium]